MTPRKRIPSAEARKDFGLSVVLLAILTLLTLFSLRKLHLMPLLNGTPAEVEEGYNALKEKKTDIAKQKFDSLLAKSPNDAILHLAIVQACQSARQWGMVSDYAQRGLKTFTGEDQKEVRSELYRSLANALSELKGANWKRDAINAAEEAYKLTPNDIESQNAYGYTLADLSDDPASIEKAYQILRGAVEMAEGRISDSASKLFLSEVLDSYGWALYKKGDAGGAIVTLQRAVNLLPEEETNAGLDPQDLKVCYYHLGAAFNKAKQTEEARRALQTALKYDPKYTEARQIYDALPPVGQK